MTAVPIGGNLWTGDGSPEGKLDLPADYRFKDRLSNRIYSKTTPAGHKTGWISLQGPTGKKGDKGDTADAPVAAPSPGGGVDFTQSTPALEWIINHNLGYMPVVDVFDSSGNEMECELFHASLNQTRARFSALRTGGARCI